MIGPIGRSTLLAIAWAAMMAWSAASAKLTNINLDELVSAATLIAHGRVVGTSKGNSHYIQFEPLSILKGGAIGEGEDLQICNDPNDVEAYDLSSADGNYIIFAIAARGCYAPLQGVRSVIRIKDSAALTGNIEGQPETQSLSAFLRRIAAAMGR
jgi:hypothetical protein